MIAAGGNWLHELLIGDAVYSMQTELGNLIRSLAANQAAQAQAGNTLGLLTGGIHAAITAVAGFAMFVFVVLMLLLLAAVTYAQVIWAQIALAILIILGPIFIPFLVFEPLSFLFWGWFRAMITYSLYAVIAGAVLRVFSAVGISYITSLGNANLDMQSFIDVGLWMIAVVPLFVAGMLASLKCGELASMLVTSTGAAGSGLMGMATTAGAVAATGGAAAAKAGAGGINRIFHFELPLHPKTYASYPVVSTANSSGLFEVVVRHILAVLRSRCAGFACPDCLAADTYPARPLLST